MENCNELKKENTAQQQTEQGQQQQLLVLGVEAVAPCSNHLVKILISSILKFQKANKLLGTN